MGDAHLGQFRDFFDEIDGIRGGGQTVTIDISILDSTGHTITVMDWIGLVLICFILPGVLSWLFALPLRAWGWIKENDLKLDL